MRAILLCLILASPLFAQAPAKPLYDPAKGEIGARRPCISDDGKIVVFSLWGDLWRWDETTGRSTQLTRHEAYDTSPVLTPDGKFVVFSSDRFGSYDLFAIESDGGPARRLTYHSGQDIVCCLSEDGKWVYFTSQRGERNALWRINFEGGTEELVLDDDLNPGDASLREGNIVYSAGSVTPYRRNYLGSSNEDLFFLKAGTGVPDQITDFQGNDREAAILPGGDILFVRETQRHFDFHVQSGGAARKLTSFDDVGAEEPRVSANGQWVVYQRRHYLYRVSFDALMRGETGSLIKLEIRQDTLSAQIENRNYTDGATEPHLSDDGKVLAFLLRGAIWISSSNGGEAKKIVESGSGNAKPRISADGKTVAFISTRSGNSDLWLVDIDGKNLRQFTTDKANDFFHNWAPDGRAIIFCSERSGNRDIWLQRLDSQQAVQITNDPAADDDPAFSHDGKLIAFDSGARGSADIYVCNADGSGRRLVKATPDVEESPIFSRDGRMIYFERRVAGAQRTSLFATTLEGAGEVQVAAEAGYANVTPDDATVIFAGMKDGRAKILAAPAPRNVLSAREIAIIARVEVDLAQERVALFNEAWESLQTRFYDPKFHGVDWLAIKARYEPVVARSRTIEELYYYIWMAIGELSASHMGVFGRRSGSGRASTADFGAKFEPIKLPDGRYALKVAEVEKNGPFEKAWVRSGDVVVGVNGERFTAGENVWARFELWTAGYDYKLWVTSDGAPENIREVAVRAEAPNIANLRRYNSLIEKRQKRVSELGANKLGYIHLTAMDDTNLANFRAYIARPEVRTMDGLIIDARGNRGGLSYMDILEHLVASPYLQIKPRTRAEWQQPRLFWNKPIVVLCDERSNSGGECFPWAIKQLKRGKVVGERTPGNVIGTHWDQLSDGSTFGVPTEGYFSMDLKHNLENDGVMPDVRVAMTAKDRVLRQDPQLEEAAKVLLVDVKAAKANPIK